MSPGAPRSGGPDRWPARIDVSSLQAILDGLLIGGVYAVISIGLTLVYGVMGIVNFAQAEFLTIGMFVAWFAWAFLGLDPVLAAPLSFAVAFAIGWVVQGQLIARVLTAPSVAQIFLTVGDRKSTRLNSSHVR